MLHCPVTAGFHSHVAEELADLFMQPGIRLPFQKNVILPAWLTCAVIVMFVPLVAVVAEAVSDIKTDAEADGVELIESDSSPSPRFDTALILIE